jgi:phosphatidylglycerol phospholipase C
MSPLGYRFVEAVHDAPDSRMVLAWTVNRPRHMRWCIRRGVDGVITDDPQEFRRICDEWEDDDEEIDAKTRAEDRKTLLEHVELVLVALLIVLFGWTFRYRTLRLQRLIVEDSSRHPEMKQGYPKT